MEKLIVSSSPHFNGGRTTQNIMLDVIIALTPAMIASVILFGFRAAVVDPDLRGRLHSQRVPVPPGDEAPPDRGGPELRGHRHLAGPEPARHHQPR